MDTVSCTREIAVEKNYDVVVLGGGPSGLMAAAAAAKAGASTAIIEQYGFFGGMATAGLVAPISVFRYNDELVVGGLPWEFIQRMVSCGGAKVEYPLGNISFSPESYKLTADQFIQDAGAVTYFHTRLIDCVRDGRQITHVLLHSKCGLFALKARIFIDCTGDADLAALANVPMLHYGEPLQPMSMYFCLNHVDTNALSKIHHSCQGVNYHMEDLRDLLLSVAEAEHLPMFGGPWMCYMMADDRVLVNVTRTKADILNEQEATRAEMQLRKDALHFTEVLKKYVPAFAHAEVLYTSTQVGIRESRHIQGVHVLTGEEYLNAVHFEDSIGRGCHPVDIHSSDGKSQRCEFLKQAAYVPYRSLITKEYDNLIVACRSFSADRIAFASTRVQACVMGLGQAAGIAAAHCVRDNCSVQNVDIQKLRAKLIKLGANI